MISFLGCHKEVDRLSPSRTPAEKALLAGLKEAGRLLPRPWISRTKPSRLGLAQGNGLLRRHWLSVFSTDENEAPHEGKRIRIFPYVSAAIFLAAD
jgi:hypothetical protein